MFIKIWNFDVELDESLVVASREELKTQLHEYGCDERQGFDFEVRILESFAGTVMSAIAAIPYGETRTYGELAAQLSTSAIAIGQACGRNPVPFIVLCHRVVGKNSLDGYSAGGSNGQRLKRELLALEADERKPEQTRLPSQHGMKAIPDNT